MKAIMETAENSKTSLALKELQRIGLLLESDPELKSVCELIAGKPLSGSWWGHPKGRDIWIATQELADHADIIIAKLISGKVTFIHRKLWPSLLAVTTSGEPWQMRDLSSAAKRLFEKVRTEGILNIEDIQKSRPAESKAIGSAVRDLESRILVFSEQFHTNSGAHAKRIESWDHWARRTHLGQARPTISEAKTHLEHAAKDLGSVAAPGRLPWNVPAKNKRRAKHA